MIAGAQGERAEQHAQLHLVAEAVRSRRSHHGFEPAALAALAEADAVVAREVGRGLGGGDEVIGRHGVLDRWERALFDRGPESFEFDSRRADGRGDLVVDAGAVELPGQPDPQAIEVVTGFAGGSGGGRRRRFAGAERRRVGGVGALDRPQPEAQIGGIAREGADTIERAGIGNQPVPTDPTIGRLDARDAAERGGLADRAAGIRADRERAVEGGDRGRGAAAAPARYQGRIEWVAGRAECRVLGRAAQGFRRLRRPACGRPSAPSPGLQKRSGLGPALRSGGQGHRGCRSVVHRAEPAPGGNRGGRRPVAACPRRSDPGLTGAQRRAGQVPGRDPRAHPAAAGRAPSSRVRHVGPSAPQPLSPSAPQPRGTAVSCTMPP